MCQACMAESAGQCSEGWPHPEGWQWHQEPSRHHNLHMLRIAFSGKAKAMPVVGKEAATESAPSVSHDIWQVVKCC